MKVKIILFFLLAMSAVGMVGYISFLGLEKMLTTLQNTVQPDFREKDLQTLLYQISESENSIRMFTITRESKYLGVYYQNLNASKYTLTSIQEQSEEDESLAQHLDTIQQLLKRKTYIQNRLIRLKRDQNRINIYEEVLTKIDSLERKNAFIDSLKKAIETAEATLEREIIEKEEELDSQQIIPEEEKKGFFRRLFSPDKKSEETEQYVQDLDLDSKSKELDTLLAAKDTLLRIIDTLRNEDISGKLEETLAEIKLREEAINKELAIIELDLTRRDNLQSFKIQQQVASVKRYFNELDINETQKALSFFDKITDQIAVIGSAFSMLFLILIFIVIKDINTNQRYRRELELAKEKAEKLALAKDEFLSNMSHEIRTPLNAIIGFSEQLIGNSALKTQDKKQLNIVHNASRHLLSIVNDILDYAKIEAGEINLEKVPFPVRENCQIIYDTLYKKAKDKQLKFELKFNRIKNDLSVIGDPVRFRQIIFNLVENAIKFTQEGFVKIHIDYQPHQILIRVLDSGTGMDKKYREAIFKKFNQGDAQNSKKYGGTGLGLAIVKKLVEIQNGSIEVKSEVGLGSEFIVTLPFETSSENNEKQKKDVELEILFPSDFKVLIVDDEEYNRLLIETVLDKHHISYKSAQSGKEAINLLEIEEFNILLMDLQMHDLNGYEATKMIRDKKPHLPIIAVTATATGDIKSKCLKAGMNDILIKPILEKDLLSGMKRYAPRIKNLKAAKNQKEDSIQTDEISFNSFDSILPEFENDMALAKKMTSIYLESIKSAIIALKKGLKNSDFKAIGETVHKIIPSSRHMGFAKFADQLKKLELAIDEKKDKKEVEILLNSILKNSNEIVKRISTYLESIEENAI